MSYLPAFPPNMEWVSKGVRKRYLPKKVVLFEEEARLLEIKEGESIQVTIRMEFF